MPDEKWLIWSIEHSAWWKPDWRGYTPERPLAGRYEFAQACKIVEDANYSVTRAPHEAMIKETQLDKEMRKIAS